MANTYELIETKALSSTTTSVTFTSIPQTYTDLVLQISARSTEAENGTSLRVYYNSSTANTTVLELRAVNTTIASYSVSYAQAGYIAGASSDANVFASATIYIPNYTSSNNKSSSGDIILPSNTRGNNYAVLSSRLWAVNDAVTSITVACGGGSLAQYSNFYLYGIKKN